MPEPTDLTFFTNEPGATLLDRFKQTLKDVRFFDVLVGYLRISGFYRLVDSLDSLEKIRILVGINVDSAVFDLLQESSDSGTLDFHSHKRTKEIFVDGVIVELDKSPDTFDVELGARKLIDYIKCGKLDIRAYPSGDIHAKVYISRFKEGDRDFGRVITGSSNFSESGLIERREFNVELKNSSDVRFALEKFEELWLESVDVTEEFVETISRKTWLSDQITPYQLYLKLLYEYLKEDINLDDDVEVYLPDGFLELRYQKQAVVAAKKILDAYNGVFLADVVGLGKTFVSALLAQQLNGKILVICPPVLKSYWEETFFEFGVRGYKVESLGKLEHLLAEGVDKYQYVFIDEAHRFRNEITLGYELLYQICLNKKIVLVSATPLNNRFDDILSQLKLFQPAKKSTIPGIANLEKFFSSLRTRVEEYSRGEPEYLETMHQASKEIRDKLLKYVMVRRTRTEIVKYFSEDIKKEGIAFPEVADPSRIVYTFDRQVEGIFNQTILLLRELHYSRYKPLIYLKRPISEFEMQSQHNMGGFMKGVLVKRLESSFHAFRMTVGRFVHSYDQFVKMYRSGRVYMSKKVNVYDLLDGDDDSRLMELVEQDKVQMFRSTEFNDSFLTELQYDLKILRKIQTMWEGVEKDPKLKEFIRELKENPALKGKKVVIFTESKETGDYLYERLNKQFKGEVLFYSSGGAEYDRIEETALTDREVIRVNFDPSVKSPRDQIRILLATDVLAEGINLHRSNVVINYDLPWNPTRVLQRVGRVNRVGTKHKKIHIFNFFPTSQSDEHLGLESNIKTKIQAFHDILGEDARYLTEEEQYSSHELFGDYLYKKLTDKKTFEGEPSDERSELEYLKLLRDLRDTDPDLFEKIKHLPKKARTAQKGTTPGKDSLLTFFRKGRLKKFFHAIDGTSKEITFFDAVDIAKCDISTKRQPIPDGFYPLIRLNKLQFASATSEETFEKVSRSGTSNEAYVIRRLKASDFRQYQGFTEEDEDFVKGVLKAFDHGSIPKNTTKRLKDLLERESNPLKVLLILKKHIHSGVLNTERAATEIGSPRGEVILSEYLLKAE